MIREFFLCPVSFWNSAILRANCRASLVGGTRSEEARLLEGGRMKEKEKEKKKKYCKCLSWALDFGFNQSVKEYSLLGAMKPEDRQCYQLVKVTI